MKSHHYLSVSLFFLGLFLGILITFFIPSFTGLSIAEETPTITNLHNYTYTKAICNYEEKECIDVLIKCESGLPVFIEPISKLIQFNDNWQDFRESSEKLCQ